jgi:hypothetical protein
LFAAEDVVPHLEEFAAEELEEIAPESPELIASESQELVASESQEPVEVVAPDSQMAPDSITLELQELALDSEMVSDSLPPGSFIYVLGVISSMRTTKHGIVCTSGSGHALAAVSSTRTT